MIPDILYLPPEYDANSLGAKKWPLRKRLIFIILLVVAGVVLLPTGLYFVLTTAHPKAIALNAELDRLNYKSWGDIHGSAIEPNRDIDLFAGEANRNYSDFIDYDGNVLSTVVHGFRSAGYTCKNNTDGPYHISYYCQGKHTGHTFGATISIVQDLLDEINPPGNTDVFLAY